jgi:hypothetical protein
MSALPVEDFYNIDNVDITSTPIGLVMGTNLGGGSGYISNASFMVNVTLKNTNHTYFPSLMGESFFNDKNEQASESIESDDMLFERFKRISAEYAEQKNKNLQAKNNFVAIRDCYGVIEEVQLTGSTGFFEARIYQNSSNEFVEVIRAPVAAFKKSDAELLDVGSVFYWKAGYRYTAKGTRVKVNDFNLRRIIREKSAIREKRVNKVVDDLLSIFK